MCFLELKINSENSWWAKYENFKDLAPLSHIEPEAKGKICAPVHMFLYILLVFYMGFFFLQKIIVGKILKIEM